MRGSTQQAVQVPHARTARRCSVATPTSCSPIRRGMRRAGEGYWPSARIRGRGDALVTGPGRAVAGVRTIPRSLLAGGTSTKPVPPNLLVDVADGGAVLLRQLGHRLSRHEPFVEGGIPLR